MNTTTNLVSENTNCAVEAAAATNGAATRDAAAATPLPTAATSAKAEASRGDAAAQSGTGGSPVSPTLAQTPQPDEAERVLECGTSAPLCAKTSVSRPGACLNADAQGRTDIPVCPGNAQTAAATGQARMPVLPSFAAAPHAGVSPSLSHAHGTEVPAKSGTEVPHSKESSVGEGGGVGAGCGDTGEPPVPLSAAASAAGNAAAAAKVARFARRGAWVGRAALFAAAAGVAIGAELWQSSAEWSTSSGAAAAGVNSGTGGSPVRGAAESGMGGSPMRGAAESGMGGSPMRGAPDGISRANGETWSRANGDAGWAQVAVSGTPQTHGRAAHATSATGRKMRWWETGRASAVSYGLADGATWNSTTGAGYQGQTLDFDASTAAIPKGDNDVLDILVAGTVAPGAVNFTAGSYLLTGSSGSTIAATGDLTVNGTAEATLRGLVFSTTGLYIGTVSSSDSSLIIEGGTKFTATDYGRVGQAARGSLTVQDNGSSVIMPSLLIGCTNKTGQGTVNVLNGATLTTTQNLPLSTGDGLYAGLTIGYAEGGVFNVDGYGSKVTVSGGIIVTYAYGTFTGYLNITDGGSVTGADVGVAPHGDSTIGFIRVAGPGSILETTATTAKYAIRNSTGAPEFDDYGSVVVSQYGNAAGGGHITVADGGTIKTSATGWIIIDYGSSNTSTLNIGGFDPSKVSTFNFLVKEPDETETAYNARRALAVLPAAPGILNTTGIMGHGTVQFNHTAEEENPYYLTTDGTAGGTSLIIGSTKTYGRNGTKDYRDLRIINNAGATVIPGNTDNWKGTLTVNGGALQIGLDSVVNLSGLTGSITLKDSGAKFFVSNSNAITLPTLALNGGTFGKRGSGTVTMGGVSGTFRGHIRVEEGELIMPSEIYSAFNDVSSSLFVGSGGTFRYNVENIFGGWGGGFIKFVTEIRNGGKVINTKGFNSIGKINLYGGEVQMLNTGESNKKFTLTGDVNVLGNDDIKYGALGTVENPTVSKFYSASNAVEDFYFSLGSAKETGPNTNEITFSVAEDAKLEVNAVLGNQGGSAGVYGGQAAGSFIKTGPGTMEILKFSAYSGTTKIHEGTLALYAPDAVKNTSAIHFGNSGATETPVTLQLGAGTYAKPLQIHSKAPTVRVPSGEAIWNAQTGVITSTPAGTVFTKTGAGTFVIDRGNDSSARDAIADKIHVKEGTLTYKKTDASGSNAAPLVSNEVGAEITLEEGTRLVFQTAGGLFGSGGTDGNNAKQFETTIGKDAVFEFEVKGNGALSLGAVVLQGGTLSKKDNTSFVPGNVLYLTGNVEAKGNDGAALTVSKIAAEGSGNKGVALNYGGEGAGARNFSVWSDARLEVSASLVELGADTFGLTKTGDGEMWLTGTDGYTGATSVEGGLLRIAGDHSAASGNFTVSGTSRVVLELADNGKLNASSAIALNSPTAVFLINRSSGTYELAAGNVISGVGHFEKDGGSTVVVNSGSSLTYTGETRVKGGTLKLGGASGTDAVLSSTTSVVLSATGTLELAGTYLTNDQISAGAPLTFAAGAATGGTLKLNNHNQTFASVTIPENARGTIESTSGRLTSTAAFTLGDNSTLSLKGANTFSLPAGFTLPGIAKAATLEFSLDGAEPGVARLALASGTDFGPTDFGKVNVQIRTENLPTSGGIYKIFDISALNSAEDLAEALSLKMKTGTDAPVAIPAPLRNATGGATPMMKLLYEASGGVAKDLLQLVVVPANTAVSGLKWTGAGVASVDNSRIWLSDSGTANAPNWTGIATDNGASIGVETFLNGDHVVFEDSSEPDFRNVRIANSNGSTGGASVAPASVTVNTDATGAEAYRIGGGAITGATGLTKQGTGDLYLNAANTFTGGVTIAGGRVIAASAGALGAPTDAARKVTFDGTSAGELNYTPSVAGVIGTVIANAASAAGPATVRVSGAGAGAKLTITTLTTASAVAAAFVKAGAGELAVGSATGGSLTVAGGLLSLGAGAGLTSAVINTAGGETPATLRLSGAGAFGTNASAAVENGTLDLNGNALTLATFTGGAGGAIGSATHTTLTLDQGGVTGTVDYFGAITGAIDLVLGEITVPDGTLGGTGTYTGTTRITATSQWDVAPAVFAKTSVVAMETDDSNTKLAMTGTGAAIDLVRLAGAGLFSAGTGSVLTLGKEDEASGLYIGRVAAGADNNIYDSDASKRVTGAAANRHLTISITDGELVFAPGATLLFDMAGVMHADAARLTLDELTGLTLPADLKVLTPNVDMTDGLTYQLIDASGSGPDVQRQLQRLAEVLPEIIRTETVPLQEAEPGTFRVMDGADKLVLKVMTKPVSNLNTDAVLVWNGRINDDLTANGEVWRHESRATDAPNWDGEVTVGVTPVTYAVATFLNGDAVSFPVLADVKEITVDAAGVLPSSMVVYTSSSALDGDYQFTSTGVVGIGGSTTIEKKGDGVLTLLGANTFTGGVVVEDGTLRVAEDASLGGAAGTLTLGDGTTAAKLEIQNPAGLNDGGFTLARPVSVGGAGGEIVTAADIPSVLLTGSVSLIGGAQADAKLTLGGGATYRLAQPTAVDIHAAAGTGLVFQNEFAGTVTTAAGATVRVTAEGTTGTVNLVSGATLQGAGGFHTLKAEAGAVISPGFGAAGTAGSFAQIAVARTGTPSEVYNGVRFDFDLLGGTASLDNGGDQLTFAGGLRFAANGVKNILNISSSWLNDGSVGYIPTEDNQWTNGRYVLIHSDGSISVPGNDPYAAFEIYYEGAPFNPAGTRANYELKLENSYQDLVLHTTANNSAAILWSETGAQPWTPVRPATTGWLGSSGADNFFEGDIVRFSSAAAPGASLTVPVPGDLIVTAMNVEAGFFTFDGAGKITGNASKVKGNIITPEMKTGALTVAEGAGAGFVGEVDFQRGNINGVAFFAGAAKFTNLVIGAAGHATFAGAYTLPASVNNSGVLEIDSDVERALAGVSVYGSGSLKKSGDGTLTLPTANVYQGVTEISGGRLIANVLGATGAGTAAIVLEHNSVFEMSLSVAAGNAGVFAKAINGEGSLVKSGAGTLTLTAGGTFTGTATVKDGTLRLTGGAALASAAGVNLASASPLASPKFDISSLTGSARDVFLPDVSGDARSAILLGANTLEVTSGGFEGVLSGTSTGGRGPSLLKSGAGTLTLSGANDYTGGTRLSGGVLRVGGASALGTGGVEFAGGELAFYPSASLANDISLTGAGVRTFAVASGEAAVSGVFSGGASLTLAKSGAGTLVSTDATAFAAYSGAVNVAAGELEIAASALPNALSGAGTLAVKLGAAADEFTFAATTGGAFTGTLALRRGTLALDAVNNAALANATLTLESGGTAGVRETAALAGAKFAGGTLRVSVSPLRPIATLDTPLLTIGAEGGSIALDGLDAAFSPAPPAPGQNILDHWESAPATTLRLVNAGTVVGDASLLTWLPTAQRVSRALGDDGVAAFDWHGRAATDVEGAGLVAEYALAEISANAARVVTLDLANSSNPKLLARLTGAGGFTLQDSEASGGPLRTLAVGFFGGSASDYAGATVIRSLRVRLDADNALGAPAPLSLEGGSVLDGNGRAQDFTTISGGADTAVLIGSRLAASDGVFEGSLLDAGGGAAAFVKTGAGALTLRGVAAFTGSVSVAGGVLTFENGFRDFVGAAGFSGAVAIASGELRAHYGADAEFSGVISGAGAFVKTGAGKLTLSGANTQTGGLSVSGGDLLVTGFLGVPEGSIVTPLSNNYPGAIALGAGVTAEFAQTALSQTLSGAISGAGALVKAGSASSRLVLDGRNTFTGDIDVLAGSVEVTGFLGYTPARADYSGSVRIAAGAEFAFAQTLDQVVGGEISGAGRFTKRGRATVTLSGPAGLAGFTGALNVEAGRLEFNAPAGFETLLSAPLTGHGTLAATFAGADASLVFAAGAGTAFEGALEMPRGTLDLTANPLALAGAAVSLGREVLVPAVAGGAIFRKLETRGATLVIHSGEIIRTGDLDITGDVRIRTDFTPAVPVDPLAGANLFDFWADLRDNQVRVIAADTVSGSRANVLRADGGAGDAAVTIALNDRAGETAGAATLDYSASVRTTGAARGVYLGYGLVEVRADAGKVVALDASPSPDARLHAKLTGEGGFEFFGNPGQVIELGAPESDYAGGTAVRGATLSIGDTNALGAPAPLALAEGAALVTDGISMAVTEFTGDAGTTLRLGGAAVFSVSGGSFAGEIDSVAAATVNKVGSGTLALNGAGRKTLGVLRVTAGTVDATVPVTAAGIVAESGARATFAGLALTGAGEVDNAGEFSATLLAGGIRNRAGGVASAESIVVPAGSRFENEGVLSSPSVTGAELVNSGTFNARAVTGSLVNKKDARVNLAAVYAGEGEGGRVYQVNGAVRNDGVIWFDSYGQTFRVASLANATGDGIGRYNLELDFGNPAQSDRVVVETSGTITGRHEFIVRSVRGNVTRDTVLPVLEGGTIATGARLTVRDGTQEHAIATAYGLDIGAYTFDFITDPVTGAPTGSLGTTGYSASTQAAVNSTGMLASAWFSQLDNLTKRLGDLRVPAVPAKAGEPPAPADLGLAVWLRGYAGQMNADLGIKGIPGIIAHQYGADVGADKAFRVGASTFHAGATVGYQTSRLRYKGDAAQGGRGDSDAFGAAAYFTYVHDKGSYADLLLKGSYFDNSYKAATVRGTFEDLALGATFEAGHRFAVTRDWFVEPSLQVSYTRLLADDYDLNQRGGGLTQNRVSTTDADIFRFVQAVRAGRLWRLSGDSYVQPAARLGIEEQTSTGGRMTIDGETPFRPNTDGVRAVVGFGVTWALDKSSTFNFDFETSFGKKLDRPWFVNLSYRYSF